jgi:SAM domain (Sterile alpha motif)
MRSVTIEEWLATEGLSQYAELFGQQRIALDVLSDLTDRELQDLGIPLGDRKRLLNAIQSSERTRQLNRQGPLKLGCFAQNPAASCVRGWR